jgi:DNA-binding CsgD family transcriptional regulator
MIDLLEKFIEVVAGAIIPAQAGERFSDLAEALGYPESVVIALLQHKPSLPIVSWRSTGNIEAYVRNTPLLENPISQYALAVDAPFDVSAASAALGYREDDVRRVLYPAIKDKHVVAFPVHRRGALVMYAGCAGDSPEDTPDTRAVLHAAAHVTYDVMTALAANRELTQREAACIASIAQGKSYKATGELLGMAERTVRAAVASAKRKLHAQTQAEVIAKAMGAPHTALLPSSTLAGEARVALGTAAAPQRSSASRRRSRTAHGSRDK